MLCILIHIHTCEICILNSLIVFKIDIALLVNNSLTSSSSSSSSFSSFKQQKQEKEDSEITPELLKQNIASITQGIEGGDNDTNNVHYISAQLNRLQLQSKENVLTICDYITALINETNLVPQYKRSQIQILCYLAEYYYNNHNNNKKKKYQQQQKQQGKQNNDKKLFLFSAITRDDVISYLNTLRKPENIDPMHKWVGTYTLRRTIIIRFFKWLYYPHILPSKDRPIPDVVNNIPKFKRKEISTVKPTDLWTEEDDYIFLKYCPSPRDRCYHTVSRDTSCRPSEILKLRIKDIVFKVTTDGSNKQYAQVTVNGKTGTRTLPLFNSIPYVKEWINIHHPQRANPNAFFIPTLDKRYRRFGHRMSSLSLNHLYRNYRLNFFPKLLTLEADNKIPEEDRQKIQELLRKPWNPYIRRHTALTQKAQILKDASFKQHSGWSGGSQMHLKYVHYYGNESTDVLLEAFGISSVNKDDKSKHGGTNLSNKKLSTPKQCPNCSEANTIDSKFCVKCKMILTYDAYTQTIEEQAKKDRLLKDLEDKINGQQKAQEIQQGLLQIIANTMKVHQDMSYDNLLKEFKEEGNKDDDNNNVLNSKKFEQIPIETKIKLCLEVKDESQHVIQNVILPAVNDISQYALNEPDKAREAIKKVMNNELFRKYYWYEEEEK
jgi:integrase/recombinase XerD